MTSDYDDNVMMMMTMLVMMMIMKMMTMIMMLPMPLQSSIHELTSFKIIFYIRIIIVTFTFVVLLGIFSSSQ